MAVFCTGVDETLVPFGEFVKRKILGVHEEPRILSVGALIVVLYKAKYEGKYQ